MGRKIRVLDGHRFGRLAVVKVSERRTSAGNVLQECRCDCGNTTFVSTGALTSGSTISCGCHRRERLKTHGDSGTKLYDVWLKMISRCSNQLDKDYIYYGAKGVFVCENWKDDFSAFKNWAISSGYKDGLTIDRINTEGGYIPSNCRFITMAKQQRNKRNNRIIEFGGNSMCLQDAIEKYGHLFADGVTSKTVRSRVSGYGWSFEKSISTPLNSTKGFASKHHE